WPGSAPVRCVTRRSPPENRRKGSPRRVPARKKPLACRTLTGTRINPNWPRAGPPPAAKGSRTSFRGRTSRTGEKAPDPAAPAGAYANTSRRSDVATGKEALVQSVELGRPPCLAFGPGGATLAAGHDAGNLHLWDTPTGTETRRWETGHKPKPGARNDTPAL